MHQSETSYSSYVRYEILLQGNPPPTAMALTAGGPAILMFFVNVTATLCIIDDT